MLVTGVLYLQWRANTARAHGDGYGLDHLNEPTPVADETIPPWPVALLPLVAVGVLDKVRTTLIPRAFVATVAGIWALEAASSARYPPRNALYSRRTIPINSSTDVDFAWFS